MEGSREDLPPALQARATINAADQFLVGGTSKALAAVKLPDVQTHHEQRAGCFVSGGGLSGKRAAKKNLRSRRKSSN